MPDDRGRHDRAASTPSADFRKIALAIGLGWLAPGMGHVLLGRVHRGLLFAAIVWVAFGLGLAHEGRLALRDARQPLLTTLQVVANLGVGPADILARVKIYGTPAYRMSSETEAGQSDSPTAIFRERARSAVSIYGTAYLWTAGLMNLLLLFDLWDLGRGVKP